MHDSNVVRSRACVPAPARPQGHGRAEPLTRLDSLGVRGNGCPHPARLSPFPSSPAAPLAEAAAQLNHPSLVKSFAPTPPFSRFDSTDLNSVSCPGLPAMSSRRFDANARKCGTRSTPSKTMYLDTSDSRRFAHCQSMYNHADSYCVKHHYPSPIISWIEDVSSFGDASFSPDIEYDDEHTRSSVAHSSTSSNLHDMQISLRLTDEFLELAKENTSNNLETCGILGASFRDGTYFVTMLIIPKQEGTAHSCQAVNEEEIHAVLSEQSLYPAGWIHTHPSQTCFLSSIDLHTQFSYQVMLPEAVAIVVAPTDPTRSYGIFRLTDPGGMDVLRGCDESGFHTHRETTDGSPIYETCSNVHFKPNLRFEIVDLRSGR